MRVGQPTAYRCKKPGERNTHDWHRAPGRHPSGPVEESPASPNKSKLTQRSSSSSSIKHHQSLVMSISMVSLVVLESVSHQLRMLLLPGFWRNGGADLSPGWPPPLPSWEGWSLSLTWSQTILLWLACSVVPWVCCCPSSPCWASSCSSPPCLSLWTCSWCNHDEPKESQSWPSHILVLKSWTPLGPLRSGSSGTWPGAPGSSPRCGGGKGDGFCFHPLTWNIYKDTFTRTIFDIKLSIERFNIVYKLFISIYLGCLDTFTNTKEIL